jgi:hypothetical protein
MSIRDLFETPPEERRPMKPADVAALFVSAGYHPQKAAEIARGPLGGVLVNSEVVVVEDGPASQMEEYDRMLFEGLFLRYGKEWVNVEMARIIKQHPSYRKG